MKITDEEFDAVENGLSVALGEGMLNEEVAYPAFEKMKEVYRRHCGLLQIMSEWDYNNSVTAVLMEYKEKYGEEGDYDYECDDVRHYCGGCGCDLCHCKKTETAKEMCERLGFEEPSEEQQAANLQENLRYLQCDKNK